MAKFEDRYIQLHYSYVNHEEIKTMKGYYEAQLALAVVHKLSADDIEWLELRLNYWNVLHNHFNQKNNIKETSEQNTPDLSKYEDY